MSESQEVMCECCGDSATEGGHSADVGMTCYCPMNDLLSVISKKYAIQIIALLNKEGTMRSKEIERTVGSKSSATFAKRLKELVAADLLARKQYDQIPPRVEYSLTTRGEELADRLQPLLKWAHDN